QRVRYQPDEHLAGHVHDDQRQRGAQPTPIRIGRHPVPMSGGLFVYVPHTRSQPHIPPRLPPTRVLRGEQRAQDPVPAHKQCNMVPVAGYGTAQGSHGRYAIVMVARTRPAPSLSCGWKKSQSRVSYEQILALWKQADQMPVFEHAWLWDHMVPLRGDV